MCPYDCTQTNHKSTSGKNVVILYSFLSVYTSIDCPKLSQRLTKKELVLVFESLIEWKLFGFFLPKDYTRYVKQD